MSPSANWLWLPAGQSLTISAQTLQLIGAGNGSAAVEFPALVFPRAVGQ